MKTFVNRLLLLGLFALPCLTAHDLQASAPAGRYTYPDGSQSSSQTVYDTKTGLTWQRNVSPTPLTWSAAQTACANAGLPGTGWRLPDVKELASIIDYSASNPAIDSIAFPNTPTRYNYWTGKCLYASNGNCSTAEIISFYSGNVTYTTVSSDPGYVRCVR